MSHTGLTEAAGDSSAGRDRLQHSLPPIQAKSAEDNRCAANEGILFCVPDVRQCRGKFPESEVARLVIVRGERELKGLSGAGWGGKHSSCSSGSNDSFITTTRFMAPRACLGGGRFCVIRRIGDHTQHSTLQNPSLWRSSQNRELHPAASSVQDGLLDA